MNKAVRLDGKKLYSPRYNSESSGKNAERKELSGSSQIFLHSRSTLSGTKKNAKRKKALKRTFANVVRLVAVSFIVIALMWIILWIFGKAFEALVELPMWILITLFGAIVIAGAKVLMK